MCSKIYSTIQSSQLCKNAPRFIKLELQCKETNNSTQTDVDFLPPFSCLNESQWNTNGSINIWSNSKTKATILMMQELVAFPSSKLSWNPEEQFISQCQLFIIPSYWFFRFMGWISISFLNCNDLDTSPESMNVNILKYDHDGCPLSKWTPKLAAPLCQANLWTKISPICAHLAGARPY